MKKLKFETEYGKIEMRIGPPYVLSSLNCDNATLSVQTEGYIGTDGEREIETLYDARIVEVKGYISAKSKQELEKLRQNLVRVLNGKDSGTLTVSSGRNTYTARARPTATPNFGDEKQNFLNFTCEFKIPSFYWKRKLPAGNTFYLFKRENMATTDTVITNGAVLTERTSGGVINNSGDTVGDMVITLYRPVGSGEIATQSAGSDIIVISNETTGQKMTINHSMAEGESVVIDTENTTVKSFLGEVETNILHQLDGEFMKLPLGENKIKVTNIATDSVLILTAEYYDKLKGVGM